MRLVGGGSRACRRGRTASSPSPDRSPSARRRRRTSRMENAEGLPANQVAWGRLSGDDGDPQSAQDPPAGRSTSPRRPCRLRSSAARTCSARSSRPFRTATNSPARPISPSRCGLAILIGHEANVAHIERLLNLGWQIPGFQANEASPGSALAFELFREVSTGQRYVRLAHFAQTPEQMRQATVLNLAERPGVGGGRPAGLRRLCARAVVPAGALRRDRQGRDRSRLRDDQAVGPDQPSATARSARLVSTQVS